MLGIDGYKLRTWSVVQGMVQIDDYVIDVLMRDLAGHDRRPVSFLVYLWLAAEQARRKGPVEISYQELAENAGISKSSAQSAIAWLKGRQLIGTKKGSVTATPEYAVKSPWRKRAPAAPPGTVRTASGEKSS